MAITQEPAWIIEGVYYGWLRPSFARADRIFVLRPHVVLRDWRLVKRFVSRKCGNKPTKHESLLDLYQLIRWNHTYDSEHLRSALEGMQEFTHKIIACRGAKDVLGSVSSTTAHETDEQGGAAERKW